MRTLYPLTGEIPDGGMIRQPDRKKFSDKCASRRLVRLSGDFSSPTALQSLDRQPNVTTSTSTHACNYTKKFISYKSHLLLDTKYLIMASALMPVGSPRHDGVKPLIGAINFLWSDGSLFEPVAQRPASDAMRQCLKLSLIQKGVRDRCRNGPKGASHNGARPFIELGLKLDSMRCESR
jgi:hypothetical protein